MDINEYYKRTADILISKDYVIEDYRTINCGIQFNVTYSDKKMLVRIYQNKKGIRLDLSQVKDREAAENLSEILNQTVSSKTDNKTKSPEPSGSDPDELIGTDESGKGDYFGPLVIAGAYGNLDNAKELMRLGITDSKKLNAKQIKAMAAQIKQMCPYSVVVIGNEKYNELYSRIKNLNKLLAWGHARVIENMLGIVECENALSDQFGDPKLIESALMEKGRTILLRQRPRAEENVIVAAASILARNEFVGRMDEMGEKYGMIFPKGASSVTLDVGKEFISKYGMEELNKVAKLHFKTTDVIKRKSDY